MVIYKPAKMCPSNPSFLDKLKQGTTFMETWGFSINEGGFWANLHISWFRPSYHFYLYIFFFGNRLSLKWETKEASQIRKNRIHKATMVYEDAMRNGVVVKIKE